MTNREKLWGLCLTAAMEINHHPEIGVVLGGSESGRDGVQMMQRLMFDTIEKGMDFVELPAPAPATAPLNMECACGHNYRTHFQDGTCCECWCSQFDPGPVDRYPLTTSAPAPALPDPAPPADDTLIRVERPSALHRCTCGHWRLDHYNNDGLLTGCMAGGCDCKGFSHAQ